MNKVDKKFNPKTYQDRDRVYLGLKGERGIQRLWVWIKERCIYDAPENGRMYEARRYESNGKGGTSRARRSFRTLEEARKWQRGIEEGPQIQRQTQQVEKGKSTTRAASPSFGEVYQEFHKRWVTKLSPGTQTNYGRYIRLHFETLMVLPIGEITPQVIDRWLDERIAAIPKSHKGWLRSSFEHELSVLRSVLTYYEEYHEDPDFRMPLKKRHAEMAKVKKSAPRQVSMTLGEFRKFHAELAKQKHAEALADLAVVQYFQALRVSEVAALFAEDLNLNVTEPHRSTIRVCRHIQYARTGEGPSRVVAGFKNAGGGTEAVRELWLFREAYEVLKRRAAKVHRGLLFPADTEEGFFTYRQIQKGYNSAFERAGLPYKSTHVMRHAGCQLAYNATGDLALAQQLLGNADLQSTLVYAKRDKTALRDFVKTQWEAGQNSATLGSVTHEDPPSLDANGRKRSPGNKKPAF
jgi:integrase